MSTIKSFELEFAGKPMKFEFGKFAGQANGACTVQYGGTMVLATAVLSNTIREGIDYFPLMVDYEERLYAAGKIKGSRFIKREGRPSDEAILTARLVDRSLRPLFDDSIRNDVQVVLTVLSVDQENDADVVSLVAASAALVTSTIPWHGPIGGVRVGRINGEWVLNPTYAARDKSDLDVVVVATQEKVVMIEAGALQVPEAEIEEAIKFGHKHALKLCGFIADLVKEVGREKAAITAETLTAEEQQAWEKVQEKVRTFTADRLRALFDIHGKQAHQAAQRQLKEELDAMLKADNDVSKELRGRGVGYLDTLYAETARQLVLTEGRRVDGRAVDQVRELSSEVGLLPRTHGSGLFTRGETQVLSVVTLGSPGDEQLLDTMEETGKKRFMHHYNFPGFSVGEAKPIRSPGRREIGHGALVEKALEQVLPEKEQFPYTIRVVSEVLSSNGSSSQASCCGSSLALMDAGVPISATVAGIAMGLITDPQDEKNYRILTDIQGIEDHDGDMDFKVAGTDKGVTAIQLDVKLHGIPFEVIGETLTRAKTAREHILQTMHQAIAAPRPELSPYAPRIITIKIDPELIRDVIGKGGETINKIIDECGGADVMKIDIEDDGQIYITSTNADMAAKAKQWIEDITKEITVGEVFEGVVTQIVKDRNSGGEIGAIVELAPGKDGMVHISEFSQARIKSISDFLTIGQRLKVKVVEVDRERGRTGLSVKALGDESTLVIPESAYSRGDDFSGGRPPRRRFDERRPRPNHFQRHDH